MFLVIVYGITVNECVYAPRRIRYGHIGFYFSEYSFFSFSWKMNAREGERIKLK